MNNVRKLILWVASGDRFSLWISHLGVAIAVGVAYFFAAQLSLVLLTKPDGVAVFWPAAGISSGAFIALGSRARLPVAVAVIVASHVASLFVYRHFAAASVFAVCNVGEPILVAWFIHRHFGESFRLENLRSVLGFFLAAAAAPVISGILAAVGFVLFYSSTAPFLTTWL